MKEKATQNGRLNYLVEEFKADSVQYKDLQTPEDTEGKRRILEVTYEHPNASKDG